MDTINGKEVCRVSGAEKILGVSRADISWRIRNGMIPEYCYVHIGTGRQRKFFVKELKDFARSIDKKRKNTKYF